VVLDAETVPAIDITAVSVLTELADNMRRNKIELVLAKDVSRVRDLIRLGEGDTPLRTYPTVRAAVEDLQGRAGGSETR
jgi:hypothetical protein